MRVDVKGRISFADWHLDVAADHDDGPVPCIVARERHIRDVLLPLTVRMLYERDNGRPAADDGSWRTT